MIVILNIRALLSYIIKLLTLSKYGMLDYTSEIRRMDINCTTKDNKWATMKRAVHVREIVTFFNLWFDILEENGLPFMEKTANRLWRKRLTV